MGDGLAVRAFCYLSDATLGFFTVLLKGKNSKAYNIGNPEASLSVFELATRLTVLFKERNLKVIKKERANQPGYLASKITVNCPDIFEATELGWRPSIAIEEGFKRTVESFYEFV
jgi:UDP-glucuronate decarboxylase